MSDLSHEIIEEILSRLPAKSLARFNLVCNQWRSLVSHPNFVKKHLNQVLVDQPNNHHKLIVHSVPDFYSVDYYKSTKHDFPFQSPLGRRILGSCNGLLLIGPYDQNRNDTLVLWNPLFRHYNMLPQCSSISGYVRLIGFGYDSSIDDYKVVRVITNSQYGKPMREVEQKVEVYTLKTNSWRTIQSIPYGNVSISSLHGVKGTVVNGSIYWVVEYADSKEKLETFILVFDLIDEKFRLVGAPHVDDMANFRLVGPHMWTRSLVEVRGRLGLYQIGYDFLSVMIWILKEDKHKNECWAKLMTIPKDYEIFTECAYFMKNDEVLLILRSTKSCKEDTKLVVYNPGNMTFRNLPAYGISYWYEDIIYVETLVSPLGGRLKRLDILNVD